MNRIFKRHHIFEHLTGCIIRIVKHHADLWNRYKRADGRLIGPTPVCAEQVQFDSQFFFGECLRSHQCIPLLFKGFIFKLSGLVAAFFITISVIPEFNQAAVMKCFDPVEIGFVLLFQRVSDNSIRSLDAGSL